MARTEPNGKSCFVGPRYYVARLEGCTPDTVHVLWTTKPQFAASFAMDTDPGSLKCAQSLVAFEADCVFIPWDPNGRVADLGFPKGFVPAFEHDR